jgi:hypothetical protein
MGFGFGHEVSPSPSLLAGERRVRGLRISKIEIAGIVTENHFRGQKRNGRE